VEILSGLSPEDHVIFASPPAELADGRARRKSNERPKKGRAARDADHG